MPLPSLTFYKLGAIPNLSFIPRIFTRLDYLMAFFPPAALTRLTKYVNDDISSTRDREQLTSNRHFVAADELEVLLWIAQRLDISLNIKISTDDAYKSVLLCYSPSNIVERF